MEYTSEVDIWSVACIFVEMLLRRIFIQGKDGKISIIFQY